MIEDKKLGFKFDQIAFKTYICCQETGFRIFPPFSNANLNKEIINLISNLNQSLIKIYLFVY